MFVLNTQLFLNRLYMQLLALSCGVFYLMNLKKNSKETLLSTTHLHSKNAAT